MKQKRKKLKIALISIAAIFVILVGAFYIYTLDYYRAGTDTAEIMGTQAEVNDGRISVFRPEETDDLGIGLIFYPGGKVEHTAYAPLLTAIAKEGITCFLVQMPFNLAVFDIKAADRVMAEYSGIDAWYLAGHSLGGAMASSYCDKNSDKLQGLILLGAYPVNDADIPTLAVYGSEDIKLDTDKLSDVQNVLRIEGGNHAFFGNYGLQKGDGTATISRQEQQEITVQAILEFIGAK